MADGYEAAVQAGSEALYLYNASLLTGDRDPTDAARAVIDAATGTMGQEFSIVCKNGITRADWRTDNHEAAKRWAAEMDVNGMGCGPHRIESRRVSEWGAVE